MSKVLVDRELLENCCDAAKDAYAASLLKELEAILDKPAEAEGVVFGFDDRSVKVSQEAYSIFLERERHHLAALSAVTAERDRLREEVTELDALRDKLSGLLSQTAIALRGPEPELTRYGYADIPLRVKTVIDEIDQLRAEVEGLRKDAERYRWASSGVHEAETLVSIVNCHGGYAEKVAERVDVYREAAMAAKEA